jgi:hypothetical protein
LYKVTEKLGLSYQNVKGLNNIIDEGLPGCPPFTRKDLIVGDLRLEFYYREIIPCIRSLYGDPELVHDLVFVPEHHYTDAARTCQIFSEMHTGNWWWSVQVCDMKVSKRRMLIGIVDVSGEAETRRNIDPHHPLLR